MEYWGDKPPAIVMTENVSPVENHKTELSK